MLNRASPADGDPHNTIFGPDRRRVARHPVQIPGYASVKASAPSAITDLNEILNISETGICIQFASPMKVNRLLPLCLVLSETGSRISVVGHVAWSEPSGKTGIRFPEIAGALHLDLRQWIEANAKAGTSTLIDESRSQNQATNIASSQKSAILSSHATLAGEWAEMERDLEGCSDLSATLHFIAQRALTLTWATGAAIALIDRSFPSYMVCHARAGTDSPSIGARLKAGSGFSGECVRSGKTITCENADDDPRVNRESSRALGISSIVATPVRHWGEVIGVLEIFSFEPAAFLPSDAAIIEHLATFIARAVQQTDTAENDTAFPLAEGVHEANETEASPASSPLESFSGPSQSIGRSVALGSITAACLIAVVWMLAPSIVRLWTSTPTFAVPSQARADSSPDSYILLSISDLTTRANQGDPRAQYALAMRYANGMDVAQDFRQAKDWFLRAADQGHVAAQSKLAAAFWQGRGTQQDYSKAYFWALLAQAGGDELSQQIVVSSAARLSPVQIAAEQKEAEHWLHSHSIGHATQ